MRVCLGKTFSWVFINALQIYFQSAVSKNKKTLKTVNLCSQFNVIFLFFFKISLWWWGALWWLPAAAATTDEDLNYSCGGSPSGSSVVL